MINIRTFDLNLLRVLDALLQDGSTTGAARRLGLSQPAVSAALGRLRVALNDPLFFRQGQRLEATDRARALEEPVRKILDQAGAIVQGPAAFDPSRSADRFRISGSDFFAETLMPPLVDLLERQAPGMRVHLVDLVPDNYLDTLEKYEVDLAMIPDMQMPGWIEAQPLFRSDFVVIARTGHPRLLRANVQPGATIPMDLFCDLGHVLFSPEGNERALGDAALAAVGRERRVVTTMPVFSGVYRAVAGSDLIALLPSRLAQRVARTAGLEVCLPPMTVPRAQLMMIWHRRHGANPAHRWLRARIAQIMAPLDVDAGGSLS